MITNSTKNTVKEKYIYLCKEQIQNRKKNYEHLIYLTVYRLVEICFIFLCMQQKKNKISRLYKSPIK